MSGIERVRVKICGLTRREDALAADAAGADYVGVVLSRGFGRSVPVEAAGTIVEGASAHAVAVLVNETPDDAAAAATALGADVIQLHGDEDPATLEALRERGPWRIWKAVPARSLTDVEEAIERYSGTADGLLVEGWKPGARGGVGARVSLDATRVRQLMARVVQQLEFVLAGGLTPESVGDAVSRFRPDVVDVSSGVERRMGEKDPALVRAFIESARAATRRSEQDVAS